jgi:hypothetical protein
MGVGWGASSLWPQPLTNQVVAASASTRSGEKHVMGEREKKDE